MLGLYSVQSLAAKGIGKGSIGYLQAEVAKKEEMEREDNQSVRRLFGRPIKPGRQNPCLHSDSDRRIALSWAQEPSQSWPLTARADGPMSSLAGPRAESRWRFGMGELKLIAASLLFRLIGEWRRSRWRRFSGALAIGAEGV